MLENHTQQHATTSKSSFAENEQISANRTAQKRIEDMEADLENALKELEIFCAMSITEHELTKNNSIKKDVNLRKDLIKSKQGITHQYGDWAFEDYETTKHTTHTDDNNKEQLESTCIHLLDTIHSEKLSVNLTETKFPHKLAIELELKAILEEAPEPTTYRHIDNFFKIDCFLELKGSTVESVQMRIPLENTGFESLLRKLQKLVDKYEERHAKNVGQTISTEAEITSQPASQEILYEPESDIAMLVSNDEAGSEQSNQNDFVISGKNEKKSQVGSLKIDSLTEQENINTVIRRKPVELSEEIKTIIDCETNDKVAPKLAPKKLKPNPLLNHMIINALRPRTYEENPETIDYAEQNSIASKEGEGNFPALPPKRSKSIKEKTGDELRITRNEPEANVKSETNNINQISERNKLPWQPVELKIIDKDNKTEPRKIPQKLKPIGIDINVAALMPGARLEKDRTFSNGNILPIPSRNEQRSQSPPIVRRK